MTNNDTGRFRGCWMFDTHQAVYHLDESGTIIGIHCDEIRNEVIGIISDTRVGGYIGNPGIFALREAEGDGEISQICTELTTTYSGRIARWLDPQAKTQMAA